MQEYEKLGAFYLGKRRESTGGGDGGLVLYDARDLTTHAVCVGMTGSGKTGLCIALLEEAAIDGIPSLVIDPKGDLANLLLTFPDLAPADFQPWVDPEEARRKGVGVEELAKQTATRWSEGLASWDEDGARIQRLRDAAEFAVYTPGSRSGRPLSILQSFAAPPQAVRDDGDLLRERAGSTVTSLLGLLGIAADPLKSREHILLSTILVSTWEQGHDVDLGGLIQAIQSPPMARVGVMELEAFYPAKQRFELAMSLNNLLAAPAFQAWLEGEPLDVGSLLYGANGKPRVAICSIAHLSDAERMFFVSLLLNQTIAWMRAQPGTTSLRAIVYMDEIFGYFPPTANPPSKGPLLVLMKQARAFGVGVVLATQNPVDLDYKGLANAGTWFVGKLQTERDRARLLDGLESAGGKLDRARIETLLDGTGNRVFLLHDVHQAEPFLFETRWTLCYLRGPMTRDEIKRVSGGAPQAATGTGAATLATTATKTTPGAASRPRAADTSPEPGAVPAPGGSAPGGSGISPPVLPPDVPQVTLAAQGTPPAGATLVYVPQLIGSASLRFADAKSGVDVTREVAVLAPPPAPGASAWLEARDIPATLATAAAAAVAPARFAPVPPEAGQARNYARWSRDLVDWLSRNETLTLWRCVKPPAVSRPDENERDFRIRLRDVGREARDAQAAALRAKYAPRHERLEEQVRRATERRAREAQQAQQQKLQTAVSVGATLLGAFLGGGRRSSVGRVTTAARGLGRAQKESGDVARADESLEVVQAKLQALDQEFAADVAALESGFDAQSVRLDEVVVRAKKSDVAVRSVRLAWAPFWEGADGKMTPAWE